MNFKWEGGGYEANRHNKGSTHYALKLIFVLYILKSACRKQHHVDTHINR